MSFAPAQALADALFISYGLTMANPKQACVVVKNASYTAFNTQLQNCGFNGPPGAGGGVLAVNSSVVFVDSSVNAPNGPGIAARGGATLIEGSLVFLARGAGLLLFEPQSAAVHDSHVWLTQPFPGGHPQAGAFGDGMAIAGGGNLWVGDTLIEDSARAGLSNFGSFASLGDLQIECAAAFDLEGESFLGQNFSFVDRGGNQCGCPQANGSCEAVSVGFAPPEAIDPIP